VTRDKALKRATRARMTKTGERYTSARRHVVKPEPLHAEDLPQPDAAVRKNTGKGYRDWFRLLDAWGARQGTHKDIARYLNKDLGVPGWWAQTITVGYERTRGMRAKYERLSGGFSVSVSKTMPIGVGRLFKAFTEAPQRNKWLEKGTLRVRTSQKNKTARFDYEGGPSRVVAYFESKGRAKTTVTVEHQQLPEAAWVEKMRSTWKERLNDLATILQGEGRNR
jgi:hypothetical protein